MISLKQLKGFERLGSKGVLEKIMGTEIDLNGAVGIKITNIHIDDITMDDDFSFEIRVADGYAFDIENPGFRGETKVFVYTSPDIFYHQLKHCAVELKGRGIEST